MLLILAGRRDRIARLLVERWKEHDARLLTCRDLSRAGWRYYPGQPAASRAVVCEDVVAMKEIKGLLTRLPAVTEDELPHIAPAHRTYVAAEMTAFLAAWLAEADFPVLNRPTPVCLTGPSWSQEQWACAAARAGMKIAETKCSADGRVVEYLKHADEAEIVNVTLVGQNCLGPVSDALATQVRSLAATAGVELLALQFIPVDGQLTFLQAYLGPDVSQPEVAAALLENFQSFHSGAIRG